jgi:hypothetical protein
VDVGEGEHHACALAPDGRRLYDRPLPNDEAALVEVPCGLIFLVSGVHDQVVMVDG